MPGSALAGCRSPLTLSLGQSARFKVTFTPATVDSVNGSITFVINTLDTTVNQVLSGNGVFQGPSVSLSRTPSTSPNVAGYDIYRITSLSSTAPSTPSGFGNGKCLQFHGMHLHGH